MNEMIAELGPQGLLNAPWISALGWALIHFLWQGALVGAVFGGGCWLLRHARPQARYLFGLICMLALLLAPVATFFSLLQLQLSAPIVIAWPDATLATQAAVVASGWDFAPWFDRAMPWIVLLWSLGVAFMTARVGLNWYRMVRCTRVGVRPLPEHLLQTVEVLKQLFGIRHGVQVLETTLIAVPTVLGWLRPVILLPTSSLVGLSPAQLELVIAHELGHIRRLDYVVNLFQVFVETLLYYHPVVGWISRRVRHEREQCCDDLVIERCGNRIEYAKALTNLESIRSGYLAPALAATEGKLVQRIERIVCAHGRRGEGVFSNSGMLLFIATIVLVVGQLADPMAAFEDRRSRLGDALVAELLADQQERDFVALDQVSVTLSRPTEIAPAKTPARTPTITPQVSTPAPPNAAVKGVIVPQPQSVTEPSINPRQVAFSKPVVIAGAGIASPRFDRQVATRPIRTAAPQSASGQVSKPAPPPPAQGPVAIQRVSPEYPVRARVAGQQGHVTVEFTVRQDGRVGDVKIADSRPRRVFDRAAMRAIRGWRFDPSTVSGSERVSQRFDFNLQRGAPLDPADHSCLPLTGTRICRPDSPTSLMAAEANLP